MRTITTLPANRLTAEQLAAWARFQREDPAVDSPYFRPEFTQAVAAVREDVKVAVIEEDGEPAGFFPFQRGRWGIGRPVGGPMSDFQGVIARPGLTWSADELVRGCGLRAWDFDHLVAAQGAFRSFHRVQAESPYMDLSRGFEAYQAERQEAGSMLLRQTLRKTRKAEREVGPLRFEAHTADPRAFAALVEWKAGQYRRTKATNVFAQGWPLRLLERVLGHSGEEFAGMLSALYLGDKLSAVHLWMRSRGVLHSWFPAYDPDLGAYSPGLVLLVEMARQAPALGIRRIDLGKGTKDYKSSFMSGAIALAEGSVALHPLLRMLRHGWHRTRAWMRSSPLGAPARLAARWTRPLRGWLAFR
jgi:CelD/BcsL family acetyltransferase involved in cellulose biosynthesis